MKTKVLIAVVVMVALALLAGCRSRKAQSAGPPPAVPVSVAVAARESVPIEIRAVGRAEAFATVQVKSQIAGELLSVRFAEGANVNKGDLLFEIDPRPYRQALKQAEAGVARDQAQLRQAEANLARDRAQARNAEAEAARYEEMLKQGIVARSQFDQMRTNADALREAARAGEAAIETARAQLESDRAAVERARLDLGYAEIRAPVAGRAGNLLVHAGNLVRANDTPLVVINQLDPVFVTFGVPERHLAEVRSQSAGRKLAVEAQPADAAGAAPRVRGYLEVIDNTVDPSTGTVKLKAVFGNPQRAIWPGQFVDVVLRLRTSEEVVVPSEAVQAGQQGQFVYVVKADKTVEVRPITAGPTVGGKLAVIAKGVNPGETVVTDGQLRLFPGARIEAVRPSESRP